jgi:hypothetical protein
MRSASRGSPVTGINVECEITKMFPLCVWMKRAWKKKGATQTNTSLYKQKKKKKITFWHVTCWMCSGCHSPGQSPWRRQEKGRRHFDLNCHFGKIGGSFRALEQEVFCIYCCSFTPREGKLVTAGEVAQVDLSICFIAAAQSTETGSGFQKFSWKSNITGR